MKKLTKIRMVNWHYFTNEEIEVDGSIMIAGENTSGKSTIMDALLMVLTTQTKHFNKAANEKSKRDLRGYVRCHTGHEGEPYARKGEIISYVALEFYDTKSGMPFTIGTRIESKDATSPLVQKWFYIACTIANINFVNEGFPSSEADFFAEGKKIPLINAQNTAGLKFRYQLGLDDTTGRYSDITIKAMAFKPIDNVQAFIKQFVLEGKPLVVDYLLENFSNLRRMDDILKNTKRKVEALSLIIDKNGYIKEKDFDALVLEGMFKKIDLEQTKHSYQETLHELKGETKILSTKEKELVDIKNKITHLSKQKQTLDLDRHNNETTHLKMSAKEDVNKLTAIKEEQESKLNILKNEVAVLEDLFNLKQFNHSNDWNTQHILTDDVPVTIKHQYMYKIKHFIDTKLDEQRETKYEYKRNLKSKETEKIDTINLIESLRNKKLVHDKNTTMLVESIRKEFSLRGIDSTPRILSDLLEVVSPRWQNAVEGYLNSQRFYVLVEPQYYDIALDVYHKNSAVIHTVGLINTQKFTELIDVAENSLAYIVHSENHWAKNYINYLLKRVTRCDSVHELKEHATAITADCMIYQNYAVRKLNKMVYATHYIGKEALQKQLENAEIHLEKIYDEIKAATAALNHCTELEKQLEACNIHLIVENIDIPHLLPITEKQLKAAKSVLNELSDDPTLIELEIEIERHSSELLSLADKQEKVTYSVGSYREKVDAKKSTIENKLASIKTTELNFENYRNKYPAEVEEGLKKYEIEVKYKRPEKIKSNFSGQVERVKIQRGTLLKELIELQTNYCREYDSDFGKGIEEIESYLQEHHKLSSQEIIKHEESVRQMREKCNIQFRESFLAKLKGHLNDAKKEFKDLNNGLENVFYGEDQYQFEVSPAKNKEALYHMIMKKNSGDDFNLWSDSFEAEYKADLEELFEKLTMENVEKSVLDEYTDYRNYLSFDIQIYSKQGQMQKFSKILSEKSGGETQTPFYVAIVASFLQVYKDDNTIKLIMFDEAFDKMDDFRITTMLEFLKSKKFQFIIAAPTPKVDVVGEHANTILRTYREGNNAIIEDWRYD